jgi:hypothetical protein
MPLDTVKTRMQSIEAKAEYKNSFHCAARVVREEGFLTLWSGAVPRLGRLILSGGIVFTMYVFLLLCKSVLLTSSPGMRRPWTCSTSLIQKRNIFECTYAQTYAAHPIRKAVHTYKYTITGGHHTTATSLLSVIHCITVVPV